MRFDGKGWPPHTQRRQGRWIGPVVAIAGAVLLWNLAAGVRTRTAGERALRGPSGTPRAATEAGPPDEAARVQRVAEKSVVTVVAIAGQRTQQGTGVVVAPGYVVTNRHVLAGATSVAVRTPQRAYPAQLRFTHPRHDLCALSVPDLPMEPAAIRKDRPAVLGERVYAVGSPRGFELTNSPGNVTALRNVGGSPAIQFNAPVEGGNSGGGLFDADGALLGVVTAQGGATVSFALPAEIAYELPSHPGTAVPDEGSSGFAVRSPSPIPPDLARELERRKAAIGQLRAEMALCLNYISQLDAVIADQRRDAETRSAAGDVAGHNALVPTINRNVAERNREAEKHNRMRDQHNALAADYNRLVALIAR